MLEMRFPTFKEGELADVLAYVFVSRYAGTQGDPLRGKEIYRAQGCAFCHGLDGEGTLGPPLEQVTPGAESEEIVQRMWNHAPEMWGEMGEHQIEWPRFDPYQLADLLSFMRTAWE